MPSNNYNRGTACQQVTLAPRSLWRTGGFTLIEILVVLGLFTIVGSLALVISFATFGDSSYHADRASLIAALEHARAESINDVCDGSGCSAGAPHGVSIQADRYVIFQGPSYAARDSAEDESVDANPAISHSGISEVVFATSSGDATETGDIILADTYGHISTTTIGSEGQIFWSN